jgi:hypothetical protein
VSHSWCRENANREGTQRKLRSAVVRVNGLETWRQPSPGLARKAIAFAISSSSPTLPAGTWANIGRIARSISCHGVSTSPKPRSFATSRNRSSSVELRIVLGATALTVIPSAATAFAKETVIAFSAVLHAE